MKKVIPLVYILLLVAIKVTAQNAVVKVFDMQNGNPVNNVAVFNRKHTVTGLTDSSGSVILKGLSANDTLTFQHPSYNTLVISFKVIKKQNFKVELSENFIDLDEVVVSANKWEQKRSEVPNEIIVINKTALILNNPATTADMFSQTNAVFVQKSQLGGGSPMIRGFAANKILFVLDGIRMNNAIYRSGNLQNILQADVNSIGSAEIILGPGTNIYGSDALGGVMDIHIKNPVLNNDTNWKSNGNIFLRLGSAAFEKTIHTGINIANNKTALLTLISFSDFDDLKMGKNGAGGFKRLYYVETFNGNDNIVENSNPLVQKFSGYSQWSFIQKLKHNINPNTSVDLGFYYTSTGDVPRYDRLTQEKKGHLKYAEWYYKPQDWMMAKADINTHKRHKLYDNSKFSVAWQLVKEGRNDRKYQDSIKRIRTEKVNIASFNADFDKKAGENNLFFYGAEMVYNNVISKAKKTNIYTGNTLPAATRYPDGGTDYFHSGIYLSYKNRFKNIPLNILGGIRYSYTSLKSRFVDTSWYHLPYTGIDIENGSVSGNLGVVYNPDNWNVKLNLSSGFRAPNLDDVAKIFDSEPGNVTLPNENLKPEYLYNAEVGVSHSFHKKAGFETSLFYSYMIDAMVRGDFSLNGKDSIMYDGEMSKIQAIVNTGSAQIWGFNVMVFAKSGKYSSVEIKANYIKGFDNNNNPLRHVPPFFGNCAYFYEKGKLLLKAEVVFNGKISYENLAPSEKNKAWIYAKDENGNPYSPAWWVFNIKGSYSFTPGIFASFGIENIFNKFYRPYSSGIASPGRNFTISVNYGF